MFSCFGKLHLSLCYSFSITDKYNTDAKNIIFFYKAENIVYRYLITKVNGWILQFDGQMVSNNFRRLQEILHQLIVLLKPNTDIQAVTFKLATSRPAFLL